MIKTTIITLYVVVFSIQISFMNFSVPLVGIRAILFNPWQIQGCPQLKWHEPLQLEVDFIKGTPLQDCQICLELISTVEAMVLKAITSAEIEASVSIECRVVGKYKCNWYCWWDVLYGQIINHSSLQTSPTRRPSYGMTRTRSQAQILGHSSGEDSYASSSRPPSTYDTYR